MAAASTTYTKKVSNSSHSHVHDDIALSILSKLPIKSLTRFTCAKKSWSLLFQNPNFMNMFRTNFFLPKHDVDDESTCLLLKEVSLCFTPEEYLYILSGESFENKVSLDWPPPFKRDGNVFVSLMILGSASVKGTLCLYKGLKTVLWNLATKEFKIIPPSLDPYDNIEFNSPPNGFGYDSVRDDFKVIRKVQYPLPVEGWETDDESELNMNENFWEEEKLKVKLHDPFWEIYSLKSNSWRNLDMVDTPLSYPDRISLVNMNGFCHWLTQGRDMVSFDFSKEIFITTTLPSNSDIIHEQMTEKLVELNGSLSYITSYDGTPYFHIWILGELGVKESWTKFFVVGPLTCSIISDISVGNKNRIFFREEDLEEHFEELYWFDLSTQKIEKIEADVELFCSQIAIYKENLHPLRGMNN